MSGKPTAFEVMQRRHAFAYQQCMLRTLFLLSMALTHFGVAQAEIDDLCPTRDHVLLDEAFVTPEGLEAFTRAHEGEIRNPGDLVCCLPKAMRSKFVIIHSSVSAQTSDLGGPRVIMFTPQKHHAFLPKLRAALSFNGGDPSLQNANNVEMVFNRKLTDELEYRDIEFESGKVAHSEANPQTCLNCHGNRYGSIEMGGPRTIFEDVDQWTRAVQGVHACSDAEVALSRAIERAVEQTFRSNPRYRCLDQQAAHARHFSGQSSSTAADLTEFDNMLTLANGRRIAKLIRRTPQFDQFKYAIIGSLACFQFENCGSNAREWRNPQACNATFENWISPSILRTMNQVGSVNENLRSSRSIPEAVRAIFAKSAQEATNIERRQWMTIDEIRRGGRPAIEFYRGPLNTCADPQSEISRRMTNLSFQLSGDRALDLYKADAQARAVRGQQFNPFFRYIFASRGIDISSFSMDPSPETFSHAPSAAIIADEIIAAEPWSSPLKAMLSELRNAGLALQPDDESNRQFFSVWKNLPPEEEMSRQKTACARLERLSARQFPR